MNKETYIGRISKYIITGIFMLLAGTTFGICLISSPVYADQTINLVATRSHELPSFKKFLFSWPISKPIFFTGLSGVLSAKTSRDSFGEALISFHQLPEGACPKNGEVYSSYTEILTKYPGMARFYGAILKKPTKGDERVAVNFKLPGGVKLSNCIVVILDGSMVASGGLYSMSSNVDLHYVSTKPAKLFNMGLLGDEFCFGMERGCNLLHNNGSDQSYTTFFDFAKQPTTIAAVHGDTSSAAFSPDLMSRYSFAEAKDKWRILDELYAVDDCSKIDPKKNIVVGFHVPATAKKLNTTITNGSGLSSAENRVDRDVGNIALPAGGCLAHYTKKSGDGGIDAEYQIMVYQMPTAGG